jgi:hypothetical protein
MNVCQGKKEVKRELGGGKCTAGAVNEGGRFNYKELVATSERGRNGGLETLFEKLNIYNRDSTVSAVSGSR